MMEIHIDQERPPAIQKTTPRYFSKNWKKSTQDRHSSSKLGWLAEWKRGGWYEKSEGSRALMFKSFLYDKHAALLEPVKRKEELCREERGSCSTLPWRTTWDLGTGHNRGYDQPWKLTLQTGLVTHRYHADVQLRNLNSGPNLGWDSFCFHARIWLKFLYFQGLLHKNTKNDVFKMGLWWDRGRDSPGRVNFWSTQVCTLYFSHCCCCCWLRWKALWDTQLTQVHTIHIWRILDKAGGAGSTHPWKLGGLLAVCVLRIGTELLVTENTSTDKWFNLYCGL